MNIYAVIILSALILDYALDRIADALNLKALSGDLPDEFKDVFDAEKYRRSQEYTRVKTRFNAVASTVDLVLILIFWFGRGFELVDALVRSVSQGIIQRGLLYVGVLILLKSLLSLPFHIYATFVIEERFGFNKTTIKTFITDLVKMVLLAIALGGPLLAGVLALFQYAGRYAWIYGWIATALFTLFIQYIAPTWILPLFNKFKPLQDGDLRRGILDYTRSVRFPVSEITIMDGSKRSSKSNAFFTGFGRNKRIALFDTLVERHTVPELVTVLAHEIGHYIKKHILIGLLIAIAHAGVLFYLLSIFLHHEGLYAAFYMSRQPIYAGMVFFGLLYAPIEMILSMFMNILSRRHERAADRFAVETSGQRNAFIGALKKLSADNLSNLRPHPFYVFLNYSHPPVLERIRSMVISDPPV